MYKLFTKKEDFDAFFSMIAKNSGFEFTDDMFINGDLVRVSDLREAAEKIGYEKIGVDVSGPDQDYVDIFYILPTDTDELKYVTELNSKWKTSKLRIWLD